jgi:2-dehydro-3-deoxygluconokinase
MTTTTTRIHQSQRFTLSLVDGIEGGDSFAAGLIHGFVSGRDLEATAACAVAAGALKQTLKVVFQKESS